MSAAPATSDDHASPAVQHMSQQHQKQMWLEYAHCKHLPVLQWLPTKLAEWMITNNMQDKLGFPDAC